MRTVTELVELIRDTVSVWWRRYPRLLLWFCLGFAVHHLGQQTSALVGADHQLLATMLFVLGVMGWLGALVMMIHELKPSLWTPSHLDRGVADSVVPQPVFSTERGIDVLTLALAPFLAVYSAWGLVEDEVSALLFANISREGTLTDATTWSISYAPERFGFYALLAVGAWLVSKLVALVRSRLRTMSDGVGLLTRVVGLIADGTAVFGLFVALAIAFDGVGGWWQERQAAVWLDDAWRALVALLPDWQLWSGLTLPEVVRDLATWFWSTLLPATSQRVMLPLMWLALTATVFGWREFRGRDIAAGTRFESVASRLDRRARPGAVGTVVALATDDLRTKYLPVANALRLVWHAGPRFVGVYLVTATLLWAGEVWVEETILRLVGPRPTDVVFVLEPFYDLVLGAVFVTLSISLYATAFDRAVAEVTRTPWRRPAVVARQRVSRTSSS